MSRSRPAYRRLVVAGCAAVLISPPVAWAHNGAGAAFNGKAGPYTVYCYDPVPADAPGTLAYTVILRVTSTGEPVDGARVTVTADSSVTESETSQHRGPIVADPVANVYQYLLPDPGARVWGIRLQIDGPAGPGEARFTMHGLANASAVAAAPRGSGQGWVRTGVGIGLAATVALGVWALAGAGRRRRPVGSS